jgi:hypothetical protein
MQQISYTEANYFFKKKNVYACTSRKIQLIEHETFTDLLRAVFHLTEELDKRETTYDLPVSEYKHLKYDVQHVYNLRTYEWLNCMEYLKNNYPYLFSLAMRTNPFDPNKNVVIHNEDNNHSPT